MREPSVMECKIEHGNEKMNARIVLEDLFLKDSVLSERRGHKMFLLRL